MVSSRLQLAVLSDGVRVTTIEGVGAAGALDPLQEAFLEHGGLQCGACTPGQVLAGKRCSPISAALDRDEARRMDDGQSVPLHGLRTNRTRGAGGGERAMSSTEIKPADFRIVGKGARRIDGAAKLRGAVQYVADISAPRHAARRNITQSVRARAHSPDRYERSERTTRRALGDHRSRYEPAAVGNVPARPIGLCRRKCATRATNSRR